MVYSLSICSLIILNVFKQLYQAMLQEISCVSKREEIPLKAVPHVCRLFGKDCKQSLYIAS